MKLSVLIPTYNHESYIEDALQGVLIQKTDFDFEILIGEDESSDRTREICISYAKRHPKKIRLFLNERKNVIYIQGKPTGRRNLINLHKEADGEFIALCEGDDYWTNPHKLQRQVNFLESRPDYAICFHPVNWLKEGRLFTSNRIPLSSREYYTAEDLFANDNFIRTCSVVYRNKFRGKFPEWLYEVPYGDVAIHILNSQYGKIGLINSIMAVYRVHKGGIYSGENKIVNWLKSIQTYETIASRLGYVTESSYHKGVARIYYSIASETKQLADAYFINKNEDISNMRLDRSIQCQLLPAISVIMPTYNRPSMLAESIDSVLNQTYKDFELIIVNDAGVEVLDVIEKFKDRRIKYYRHERNQGLAAARNTGIINSRGKYICYLDDDDIYYNDHLEKLLTVLKTTDAKIAYTNAHRAHQKKIGDKYVITHRDLPFNNDFDNELIFLYNLTPVLCIMHSKSCIEEVGLFDESFSSHEDWDLWIRMSRKYHFQHIDRVTAEFRWRNDGSSMSSGRRRDMIRTLAKIYQKHQTLVQDKPHLIQKQQEIIDLKRKEYNLYYKKNSIIIPVFNKIEHTKRCIDSIFQKTNHSLVEIIVVDNASTDGTQAYLNSISDRVFYIRNEINQGFAKACNQGAKVASGDYLLFLNNDTIVENGWLSPLSSILDNDPNVVAVGSKLLFPDRRIQHAGVVIIENKNIADTILAEHIYYKEKENLDKANISRTYQALTAACLLLRKSAFDSVGGFDEEYWNGYEDVDLCLKLQEKGWLLVYEPQSVVIHFESQSGPERFKKVHHNIERLHRKWVGKILPDFVVDPVGIKRKTDSNRIRPYNKKQKCTEGYSTQRKTLKPVTSIIILACNQLDYTRKCIQSIINNTLANFELIIVDNASTDGTIQYLQSLSNTPILENRLKVIRNSKNMGFAAGNNQGIAAASGDYILLMNNDVVVTPCWLERLINCAKRNLKIGIVGPCSSYVSGTQLVKDVTYDLITLDGLSEFSNKFADEHADQVQQILRVVGFCMLIKRAVIDKIGGMDDRYGLGNFEDDDFSLRATIAGFQSWIARDCFIHHFGHRTFIGEKVDLSKSLHKNWDVFKDKWGLPAEKPYGTPYRLSEMKNTRFDPSIHYYPLDNESVGMKKSGNGFKTAEALYSTIHANLNTKPSKEVIVDLQNLIASYPDFALAHNDLGVIYYHTGNKEKAQHHYESAVEMMPENINFQKNLADFYCLELGRIEEALKIYVDILITHPQDVETLLATGQICVALEKPGDARDFFNRVLEIEPWNEAARQHLDELERPPSPGAIVNVESPDEIYERLKQNLSTLSQVEAIDELEKLLGSYPDFALGHNDLGVLYYHNGDKEKTLHHYRQAAQLQPENLIFQKNLADLLFVELGKIEKALQIYVNILALNPHDVEILLITGHICVGLKKFDDARNFYHRVLELEPGNEDAGNNLRALNKHPAANGLLPAESANSFSVLTDKVESDDLEADRSAAGQQAATVSIIISLDGIQNRVKECIKSVMEHTSDPHEILLINRGATKGLLKWAQQLAKDNDHYHIIGCARQAGRAEYLNQAIQKAGGEMVVFLHNDVVVPEGWLKAFKMCINLVPNIGAVGPMSNRTGGIQQIIHSDESDRVEFESAAKAFYEQNQYRRVVTRKLSDFCLAFPRELPDKIGYFDEQFVSEEVVVEDFCKRAASGGYQNLIAADTYVYHYDRHKNKKNASTINSASTADRKKYKEKWNGTQNPEVKALQTVQLLARTEELSQKGKIDAAVEVLLGGIGVQPEDPRFYLALSEILLTAKKFQDTKEALTEMPSADEKQEMRKAQLLAYAEEGLENYEAAQVQIEQVLLMNSGHAPALNLKGILAYRNDDCPSAEKYFKRAIDADPGYGEPYTNLGMLQLEADQQEEALKSFEKGFRLTPTDFDIATNYHTLIAGIAEYQKAENVARDVAFLYPNNQKIKYMLIDFLVQQGKYEMAMPEIEDAIIKFGTDNGILSAALKVREKLGSITIQKSLEKVPVSLCMIIKDEEKYLARCLASVKPIVDEMIVVDTGSTDRSKDIAITFGAKVYDYEWKNDFAEARNYSISKASGEWILILDGDEVISPLDHAHFSKMVKKTPRVPIAYSIITRNYNKLANIVGWIPNDGTYLEEEAAIGWLPSEKVRLFYGKDQIWFEGAVHELVDPVLKKNGIEIKKCRLPVHHYGRLDNEKLERKGEIYFDIGKKKLSAMGDDLNALRELAVQATILEKNQEAFELWQRLLSLNPIPNLAAIAYVNMGTIYSRLGKFEDALDAGKKAVKHDPDLKEARYNHAMAELHCGNAPKTIRVLEDLLKGFPDYPPARFILSAAYCCAHQKEKGLEGIRKLRDTPMGTHLDIPCLELAQSLISAGKMEYALWVLGAAIESDIVNPQLLALFKECLNMKDATQNCSHIPQPPQANFQGAIFENLPQ